jgi:hypothetical protein
MNRLLERRGVTSGTGFGSNPGVRVGGKIFAMVSKGGLVVKLPRARVAELVEKGKGTRFDPGHGRLMKEWLVVSTSQAKLWQLLIEEAFAYVKPLERAK